MNKVNNCFDIGNGTGLKDRLLCEMWRYFNIQFDEDNSCTWLRMCDCAECRKKLGNIPSAKAENPHQQQQKHKQQWLNTTFNEQNWMLRLKEALQLAAYWHPNTFHWHDLLILRAKNPISLYTLSRFQYARSFLLQEKRKKKLKLNWLFNEMYRKWRFSNFGETFSKL